MEHGEEERIERARSGDPAAFREIVLGFAARVQRLAYQLTGDSDDAADVAQEVFVRLHDSLHRLGSRRPLAPWLTRVTVNLAIDARRRASRRAHAPYDDEAVANPAGGGFPLPDALAERSELRGAIETITAELADMQRRVFVLRDLQGMSTAEIASVLGCRASTVRVHLARARLAVRKALAARYPEFTGGDRS